MKIFFLMAPMFLFCGFFFIFMSLFLVNLNLSFYFYWSFLNSSLSLNFPLYFDFVSCLFLGMVLLISGSIIFYSEFYMSHEVYKERFFYLMFLFVVSMIFLILSPSVFCMLLGWDGLGLVSYCLVIYYQNFKSFCSGMITALTNRVGDVFILASICMFFSIGSWNYLNCLSINNHFWVCLFFFIASLTKSAQVPFSAWLPAAMAAPTPVSSLVHSSTLVTAGIYILIRFNYFLMEEVKLFLMFISLLTMIMSGLSGLLENDLKKIIALSTLSQLGFMMATISLSFYDMAFFHLVTHASFKALLFMCAGLFIHEFSNNQDIRCYGYMDKNYSYSLCLFNVANLSLAGFPFLSGFFSKDMILEFMIMHNLGMWFFFMFMFGTFLTVSYSYRLFFFLTFKGRFYFSSLSCSMSTLKIQSSMMILFLFSIFLGFILSNLIFPPYNYIIMPFILKIIILLVCFMSLLFCYFFSFYYFYTKSIMLSYFSQMWFHLYLKTDFLKDSVFKCVHNMSTLETIFVEIPLIQNPMKGILNISKILNTSYFSLFYLGVFTFGMIYLIFIILF